MYFAILSQHCSLVVFFLILWQAAKNNMSKIFADHLKLTALKHHDNNFILITSFKIHNPYTNTLQMKFFPTITVAFAFSTNTYWIWWWFEAFWEMHKITKLIEN